VASTHKKRIILAVKILIGILSFYIIYNRLSTIEGFSDTIVQWANQPKIYVIFLIVLCLMPVNWGIESYKWKLITRRIESISYLRAVKSVLSGICIGNIAPGRALEFAAKVVFFKTENRPAVTLIHFINGMFQMLITVMVGVASVIYKSSTTNHSSILFYVIVIAGICLIAVFCWSIMNVKTIQQKLKFIKWFKQIDDAQLEAFPLSLVIKLVGLSILRYIVFTMQFYLVFQVLSPDVQFINAFTSIAAYFLLTSLMPMISVIEPAIRAAIALFVFSNQDSSITVILSSTMIWLINVVVPSVLGYFVILKEKIVIK